MSQSASESARITAEIFDLRQKVNLYLRANDSQTANKLLDQIVELESKKQALPFWDRANVNVQRRENDGH
jgi:hypothetical protein